MPYAALIMLYFVILRTMYCIIKTYVGRDCNVWIFGYVVLDLTLLSTLMYYHVMIVMYILTLFQYVLIIFMTNMVVL